MNLWKHHGKFERHSLLLVIGILVVVSIGGLVEIAPLFWLQSTIEKVDGAMLTVKAHNGQSMAVKLADNYTVMGIAKAGIADVASGKIPGAYLLIGRHGQVAFEQGFGVQGPGQTTPTVAWGGCEAWIDDAFLPNAVCTTVAPIAAAKPSITDTGLAPLPASATGLASPCASFSLGQLPMLWKATVAAGINILGGVLIVDSPVTVVDLAGDNTTSGDAALFVYAKDAGGGKIGDLVRRAADGGDLGVRCGAVGPLVVGVGRGDVAQCRLGHRETRSGPPAWCVRSRRSCGPD